MRTSLIFEKNVLGSYSSPTGFYMSDDGAITVASIVDNALGQTQIVYRERSSFDDGWGFITTILDTGKVYRISFIDDYYQQFFVEADFGGGRTTYYMEAWPANNQLIPVQAPAVGVISNLQTDIINIVVLQKTKDFYIYGGLTYCLARNDSDFVRTNYYTYGNASEDSLVFSKKKKPASTTGNVGFEYLGERMYTIWEDSANGRINLFGKKLILPVGEVEDEKIVSGFILEQNYPNPFNPSTNIQYAISSRQFVSLKLFNLLGEEIETLVNEFQEAGVHSKLYPSGINSTLPSGVYFYQLKAGSFIETKKMLLLK